MREQQSNHKRTEKNPKGWRGGKATLGHHDFQQAPEAETVEELPQQIILTSRTPLYRGPSKSARIAGASGVAVVLGKVGEFTKIRYVRRGIGVQEGYVILDA